MMSTVNMDLACRRILLVFFAMLLQGVVQTAVVFTVLMEVCQ